LTPEQKLDLGALILIGAVVVGYIDRLPAGRWAITVKRCIQ
jgi:hypothetical protein